VCLPPSSQILWDSWSCEDRLNRRYQTGAMHLCARSPSSSNEHAHTNVAYLQMRGYASKCRLQQLVLRHAQFQPWSGINQRQGAAGKQEEMSARRRPGLLPLPTTQCQTNAQQPLRLQTRPCRLGLGSAC
jgi:hypothetical protein